MLDIVRRQIEIVVPAQVVTDQWSANDEGAPLRRALIGAQGDVADDTGMPAVSGLDDKILLPGAVSAHLAEWHAEAFRADARRLGQDPQHIALAQRKAAKAGHRRLLATQVANLFDNVTHVGLPRIADASTWKPRGNGGETVPVATMSLTIFRPRSRSSAT